MKRRKRIDRRWRGWRGALVALVAAVAVGCEGADPPERIAGEEGVGVLDELLNGKGFLGKREPSEVRAAAALALGQVEGASAKAALQKAASEEDPVVRSAVNRALRKGE